MMVYRQMIRKLKLHLTACAAALARAALEAAVVNVHVNTSALLDRDFANEVDADCARMLEEYIPRAQAVVESAL